eukprot:1391720-Amorphochlora_amoeboformis.AAC.1
MFGLGLELRVYVRIERMFRSGLGVEVRVRAPLRESKRVFLMSTGLAVAMRVARNIPIPPMMSR